MKTTNIYYILDCSHKMQGNKITAISEKLGLKANDVLLSFTVNGVEYTINRSFNRRYFINYKKWRPNKL